MAKTVTLDDVELYSLLKTLSDLATTRSLTPDVGATINGLIDHAADRRIDVSGFLNLRETCDNASRTAEDPVVVPVAGPEQVRPSARKATRYERLYHPKSVAVIQDDLHGFFGRVLSYGGFGMGEPGRPLIVTFDRGDIGTRIRRDRATGTFRSAISARIVEPHPAFKGRDSVDIETPTYDASGRRISPLDFAPAGPEHQAAHARRIVGNHVRAFVDQGQVQERFGTSRTFDATNAVLAWDLEAIHGIVDGDPSLQDLVPDDREHRDLARGLSDYLTEGRTGRMVVVVADRTRDYFNVASLADVTQELLDERRHENGVLATSRSPAMA